MSKSIQYESRIRIDSFLQVPRYVSRFQELNKDFVLLHSFQESHHSVFNPIKHPPGVSSHRIFWNSARVVLRVRNIRKSLLLLCVPFVPLSREYIFVPYPLITFLSSRIYSSDMHWTSLILLAVGNKKDLEVGAGRKDE